MPIFSNDTTSKQLYLTGLNELLSYDSPGSNSKILFQPYANLVKVAWDKAGAPDFNMFKQCSFLDKLPTWGTFAIPTETSLFTAYGDFLQTLINKIVATSDSSTTISDDERKQVEKLKIIQQRAYGDRDSGYRYYLSLAEQDWADELINNPNEPNTPFNKSNFFQHNSNYVIAIGYLDEADNASNQILDILSKADPNYNLVAAAKINYKSDNNQVRVPQDIADEGRIQSYIPVPKQSFDQDIFEFETAVFVNSYSLTDQTRTSDYTETHWGGSFGVSFGFFSVGGSVHVDEITSLIHTHDISINVSFQNVGPFIITRGGWYNQFMIDKLGDILPQYFGQTGALALIPQQLICARGVEVTITSDDSTSSLFEKHFQSGGSFGYGPFNFGGSYDSTHIHTEFTNSGSSFTMKSTEKEAYILGQLCYLPHTDAVSINNLKKKFLSFSKEFESRLVQETA